MSDGHVVIIFDSTTIDGSPYKLYHALKEAANHADKKDDLIIYELFMRIHMLEALRILCSVWHLD